MSASLYGSSNKVSDIQNTIRDLLADELGTFANGLPAITVEPPTVPKAGTGVHVIISRYPTQLSYEVYSWSVALVCFDKTVDGLKKLDSAVHKMRVRFPRHRQAVIQYSEETYPQISFRLLFNRSAYLSEYR